MHTIMRNTLISSLIIGFTVIPISLSLADAIDEESAITSVTTTGKEEATTETTGDSVETLEVVEPTAPSSGAPSTVTPSESSDLEVAKTSSKSKIAVGGGAFFLNRKNFRLIQPQDETQLIATQTVGDPFEYDTHGLGSFGEVAVEHTLWNNLALGASFLGATLENDQTRAVPGGASGGLGAFPDNTSVIPLLNEFGKAQGFGSALEVGGKPNDRNARADTIFHYDTQQYDTAVDIVWNKICDHKDFNLDGLVGFGYTRINQNSDLQTSGVNINNNGPVTTKTTEALRDNLFGGRVGMRLHKNLVPAKLSFFSKIVAGFYGDSIHYKGVQEFSNANFVGFGAVHNFTLEENIRDHRFVPRLESVTGLAFKITPDLTAAIVYRFNALWELSTIDHPTVRFNNLAFGGPGVGGDIIDHPVRIGSETVTQHYIEVKLAYKF